MRRLAGPVIHEPAKQKVGINVSLLVPDNLTCNTQFCSLHNPQCPHNLRACAPSLSINNSWITGGGATPAELQPLLSSVLATIALDLPATYLGRPVLETKTWPCW